MIDIDSKIVSYREDANDYRLCLTREEIEEIKSALELKDEENSNDNPLYDPDYCYECTGYGDDYYIDDSGELVCRCFDCPFSPNNEEDE